jgi:hypothetical protein
LNESFVLLHNTIEITAFELTPQNQSNFIHIM